MQYTRQKDFNIFNLSLSPFVGIEAKTHAACRNESNNRTKSFQFYKRLDIVCTYSFHSEIRENQLDRNNCNRRNVDALTGVT